MSDYSIKLWDVASGKLVHTLAGHSMDVNALAFSPNGWLLASGSEDRIIKLWDVASGRLLRSFIWNAKYISILAFSPDGKLLAGGGGEGGSQASDHSIKLWDVARGGQTTARSRAIQGYGQRNLNKAFSPDGKLLASGSQRQYNQALGRGERQTTADTHRTFRFRLPNHLQP